jgi:hypothetical protein
LSKRLAPPLNSSRYCQADVKARHLWKSTRTGPLKYADCGKERL